MPFSLRLDPDTEAKIRRLTAVTGGSKSDVVREAVKQFAASRDAMDRSEESTFDRLRPFIGVVSTGGAHYSLQTHAKYRALLHRKHRARRPR